MQARDITARLAAPTTLVERLAAWHDLTMASYPDSAASPTWALRGDDLSNTDPAALARALGMQAHPEGGYFVESWRHQPGGDTGSERGAGTAIYFLLERGQQSHWHRVDAAEIWHFYGGEALLLEVWAPGQTRPTRVRLDAALRLPPGQGPEAAKRRPRRGARGSGLPAVRGAARVRGSAPGPWGVSRSLDAP